MTRALHPLLLGRFGLPRLPTGAVAHIKYPIVISDRAFRQATGFVPRYEEYATLEAFRTASPLPNQPSVPVPPISIATPEPRD
jgi:hypothetical protein